MSRLKIAFLTLFLCLGFVGTAEGYQHQANTIIQCQNETSQDAANNGFTWSRGAFQATRYSATDVEVLYQWVYPNWIAERVYYCRFRGNDAPYGGVSVTSKSVWFYWQGPYYNRAPL